MELLLIVLLLQNYGDFALHYTSAMLSNGIVLLGLRRSGLGLGLGLWLGLELGLGLGPGLGLGLLPRRLTA